MAQLGSLARGASSQPLVEIPVAILVAAEIVILFAGVVARFVLHTPLVWSDELASILFLWLAMLGAVVAFRRNEHMRMTAIVGMSSPGRAGIPGCRSRLGPRWHSSLLIAWPAFEYRAEEETFITTPALEITNAWRAAALPIGIGFMAVFALLRLAASASLWTAALALVTVLVIVGLFWLARSPCSVSSAT